MGLGAPENGHIGNRYDNEFIIAFVLFSFLFHWNVKLITFYNSEILYNINLDPVELFAENREQCVISVVVASVCKWFSLNFNFDLVFSVISNTVFVNYIMCTVYYSIRGPTVCSLCVFGLNERENRTVLFQTGLCVCGFSVPLMFSVSSSQPFKHLFYNGNEWLSQWIRFV